MQKRGCRAASFVLLYAKLHSTHNVEQGYDPVCDQLCRDTVRNDACNRLACGIDRIIRTVNAQLCRDIVLLRAVDIACGDITRLYEGGDLLAAVGALGLKERCDEVRLVAVYRDDIRTACKGNVLCRAERCRSCVACVLPVTILST